MGQEDSFYAILRKKYCKVRQSFMNFKIIIAKREKKFLQSMKYYLAPDPALHSAPYWKI